MHNKNGFRELMLMTGEERRRKEKNVCSHWLYPFRGSQTCQEFNRIFSLLEIQQVLMTHHKLSASSFIVSLNSSHIWIIMMPVILGHLVAISQNHQGVKH